MTIDTSRDGWERGLQRVLTLGLLCLIAGMVVLPTDEHIYERVVILLLTLPALLLIALRPSSVDLLWRQPSAKWVVLLLAWSTLSLAWSDGDDIVNWIGRNLGVFLFLYAWVRLFNGREQRIHTFLLGCCAVMALGALALIVLQQFTALHSLLTFDGGRLQGIGVLPHPNLAAAAISSAIIWACTIVCHRPWQQLARVLMVAVFLLFIVMTYSRSAWGGLFLALMVIAACRGGRNRRWILAALVALGVVAALVFLPELLKRGWSGRPAILEHAWALIMQHPWVGVGQGVTVRLELPTFTANHAHNTFAQLAIQLGLPALLVWVGIWLTLGWHGWIHRREPLGCLVLAAWVFATFMGQFDLPYLLGSPKVAWIVLWLPVAISYSLNIQESRRPS